MKKIFLFLGLLFCIIEAQAGGPWSKEKGEGYAQFAFYAIPSINRLHINAFRTKHLNRAVFDGTAEFYAEYGLTKKLTLTASLPLKIVLTNETLNSVDTSMLSDGSFGPPGEVLEAGTLFDFGNIRIGATYNFIAKKFAFAGHVDIAAPTAIQAYNSKNALRTAYPCWSFQPSVSVGFSSKKIYTYLQSGMNFRTHNYSHQWLANFEFGWKVGKTIYLAIAINASLALPGGKDVPNTNEEVQTGLYVNNQNVVAITFKALIPVSDHVGVNLSLSGGVWANNIQQGPNIGLGVYYKWKKKDKKVKNS